MPRYTQDLHDEMVALMESFNRRLYALEKSLMPSFVDSDRPHQKLSIHKINQAVERVFGNGLLYVPSHSPDSVFPRSIAMYLCRKLGNYSYPAIGLAFSKHHTTVLHNVDKIAHQRTVDSKLDRLLNDLEQSLSAKKPVASEARSA